MDYAVRGNAVRLFKELDVFFRGNLDKMKWFIK